MAGLMVPKVVERTLRQLQARDPRKHGKSSRRLYSVLDSGLRHFCPHSSDLIASFCLVCALLLFFCKLFCP